MVYIIKGLRYFIEMLALILLLIGEKVMDLEFTLEKRRDKKNKKHYG